MLDIPVSILQIQVQDRGNLPKAADYEVRVQTPNSRPPETTAMLSFHWTLPYER